MYIHFYTEISETCYDVKLIFIVSNITMPVTPEQKNETLKNLLDIMNNAVSIRLQTDQIKCCSSNLRLVQNLMNGLVSFLVVEHCTQ